MNADINDRLKSDTGSSMIERMRCQTAVEQKVRSAKRIETHNNKGTARQGKKYNVGKAIRTESQPSSVSCDGGWSTLSFIRHSRSLSIAQPIRFSDAELSEDT